MLGEWRRQAEGQDGEVTVVAAFSAEGEMYVGRSRMRDGSGVSE